MTLHAAALKNRGQSSNEFSAAVLELVRAKCEIAEHAMNEWKTAKTADKSSDIFYDLHGGTGDAER